MRPKAAGLLTTQSPTFRHGEAAPDSRLAATAPLADIGLTEESRKMGSVALRFLAFALAMVAAPVAAMAALISSTFGIKRTVSAREVATDLRNFIEGSGGDRDWDDFTSVPIANPKLENIRIGALAVDLPATEEGLRTVRTLLAEAERLMILEPGN